MQVLILPPLPCESNDHAWKPVFDRALKGSEGRIAAGQRARRACPSVALSAGGCRSFRAISAPHFTAEVIVRVTADMDWDRGGRVGGEGRENLLRRGPDSPPAPRLCPRGPRPWPSETGRGRCPVI